MTNTAPSTPSFSTPSTGYLRHGPDREHMRACLEAEAAGDLSTAQDHYRAVPDHPDPEQRVQLWEMRSLLSSGAAVPEWVWARWTARQAYRWFRFLPDPRIERVGWATVSSVYPSIDVDFPEWPDEHERRIFLVALTSWVARQIGTYEYGGLKTFLDHYASPNLLERGDHAVTSWGDARMAGYRLMAVRGDRLVLRDLSDGTAYDVLSLRLAEEISRGGHLIGRLVPISESPGLIFESRPVSVDPRTAHDVAESGEIAVLWLTALWRAVDEGRMPFGFDLQQQSLLGCDLSLRAVREELARASRSA